MVLFNVLLDLASFLFFRKQMLIFHVTHLNQKLLVGELLCYHLYFSAFVLSS